MNKIILQTDSNLQLGNSQSEYKRRVNGSLAVIITSHNTRSCQGWDFKPIRCEKKEAERQVRGRKIIMTGEFVSEDGGAAGGGE